MKPVDIIVILCVIAVLGLAVWLNGRRKKTSSCCGGCSKCAKANAVADRKRANYPFEIRAEITGMTCQNCAVTVENALNALEGVWAVVRIDTKTARILCKTRPDEEKIRRAIHDAGYGVGRFEVVKAD